LKILGIRALMPAIVTFLDDKGHENKALVKIDAVTNEVTLDNCYLASPELHKEINNYIKQTTKPIKTPTMPTEGFERMKEPI